MLRATPNDAVLLEAGEQLLCAVICLQQASGAGLQRSQGQPAAAGLGDQQLTAPAPLGMVLQDWAAGSCIGTRWHASTLLTLSLEHLHLALHPGETSAAAARPGTLLTSAAPGGEYAPAVSVRTA